ncbi:DUF3793 family protein [Geobacter pickeringii]|uniref:DUF3793 domain-containing protein n=1 Tax=Geobacter pickeringii TaxID=345632 RepID=A0A0B5BEZ6_9BACT|nr:DUF3793 family protein [Geobacter pickeringii]AJE02646.1 hypothetical protein GPICK_04025 [Geobacter pickeringii]
MDEVKSVRQEGGRRSAWHDLAVRFDDPRECLASFLALEAAEVLAGEKPANLIGIANRPRPCGRNLYTLWKQWGASVLPESGLAVCELADRGDSLLLLIYRSEALGGLLRRPSASAVLGRAGYADLSDLDAVLGELAARITGEGFPHEIGVFLGYPLKDVAAFMGLVTIPFACQGPWKIFGDPRESLRLAEIFRTCRARMAERLGSCASALECLVGGERPVAAAIQ